MTEPLEDIIYIGSSERLIFRNIEAFDKDSGEAVDPAAANLPVYGALKPEGAGMPSGAEWLDGEWLASDKAAVVIDLSSGGLDLDPGRYLAWLRIDGTIEKPKRPYPTIIKVVQP